jgi:hypothetical protein
MQKQLILHTVHTSLDYLLCHVEGYHTDLSGEYMLRLDDLLCQDLKDLLVDGAEKTVNLANFSAGVWDSCKTICCITK